jgi:hypothetical protein
MRFLRAASALGTVGLAMAILIAAAACGGDGIATGVTNAPDATVDAPRGVADANRGELSDLSKWATLDTSTLGFWAGFDGATFDGRFVYLAARGSLSTVVRYDTQAAWSPTSWEAFDTRAALAGGFGSWIAPFDGRYVYFAPPLTDPDGGGRLHWSTRLLRYDTRAAFATRGSWATFDPAAAGELSRPFTNAAFDGRYIYLVTGIFEDSGHATVSRYDTKAAFADASSYATFDVATLNAEANGGLFGAAFDGRYVYFVCSAACDRTLVARYDTRDAFTAATAWTTIPIPTDHANDIRDIVFDGRYVYFVPARRGNAASGDVDRYDTQGELTSATAWATFDTTALGADEFWNAMFDGRYVYFCGAALARYDTQAPFAAIASWATFDARRLNGPHFGGGCLFDGRYGYFDIPETLYAPPLVARFDTR